MKSAISWFEIPSLDLDKSQSFYETVLGCTFQRDSIGPSQRRGFPV